MIVPTASTAAKITSAGPVAYAGGQASTAKPSFGASLQATLAQLQATNQGVTAGATAHQRHHGHAGLFERHGPFSGGGSASAATPTMPAL